MTLLLLAALPFLAMLGILAAPDRRAVHSGIAALASALACVILIGAAPIAMGGGALAMHVDWVPAIGLDLALRLDALGLLFAAIICGIGLLVIVYAHAYLAPGEATRRFFASLILFQGAMLGIVLAGNLLLLLVFWELTSLSSFLLIGFWRDRAEARQGARMALAITGGGGLVLIAGLLLLGLVAGSFELSTVLERGDVVRASPFYPLILGCVLVGCGTKSAQFPFHFWLPHAMAAPTPVSAYLHSATMVKAGVFLLARLSPVLGGTDLWTGWVTGMGLATMTLGACVALFRHDLKAILAYSTVSQLGLLVMLLGLSTPLAFVAATFHIINHAAFKAALFMSAGIVDHATGTRDIRRLGGLARAMPVTALIVTVAAAAMAGLPPLGGFISKEMMLNEVVHATLLGSPWLVAAVATIASAFSVAYSVRFAWGLFGGAPREAEAVDPSAGMWGSPAVLAALALALGLVPMLLAAPLVAGVAAAVLGTAAPEVDLALWHGVNLALGLSAVAIVGGLLLAWRRERLAALAARAPRIDGKAVFEALLAMADALLRRLSVAAHRPSLQTMLLATFAIVTLAAIEGLTTTAAPLTGPAGGIPASPIAILVWILLVAGALGVVVAQRRRLAALVLVSIIGLMIALAFVHLSAPDLALTQIAVEVATILLLLLALHLMPKRPKRLSSTSRRVRDVLVAGAGGAAIGGLAWAMLTRPPGDTISAYHWANSYAGGGGTNVVNVTLVDFRAFDTMGEIIVLGIAGLAIYALLETASRGAAGSRLRTWQSDMPHSPERHPMLFVMATRILLPLTLLVAVYLFLRGHNQPGGGFVAGLVVAIGFLLQYLASGFDWTDARRRVGEHQLIAFGVLVTVATGLGALAFGAAFLTSAYGHLHLPVIGDVELATAMLFDLGVFAAVLGAVLLALAQLSHVAQRAARAVEPVEP